MKELTKQEFNDIIAEVAEHGTGIIETADKEPPWIVRNVNGFIYAVEIIREHHICTVMVPINNLNTHSISEIENALEELNRTNTNKYGYYLKYILDTPLITISAYYDREDFDVTRDIIALEHHTLHVLNEI